MIVESTPALSPEMARQHEAPEQGRGREALLAPAIRATLRAGAQALVWSRISLFHSAPCGAVKCYCR